MMMLTSWVVQQAEGALKGIEQRQMQDPGVSLDSFV